MKNLNLKDESGQTMILTLLCMTILLGFVGFAADIGIMFHTKRNLQIAADSAAIAGAAELNYGDWDAAGHAAAAQNGVTNGSNGAVVAINNPPLYGAFAGNINYVEAVVTQDQPTIFAAMLNFFSINVGARAVATMQSSSQLCMYLLGTSGADLDITGNSSISMSNCGIADNANMDLTGNITVNAKYIGVAGSANDTGNIHFPNGSPITGIVPESDPLAYLPDPAIPANCSADPDLSGTNTATISHGCYDAITLTGNSVLTLNPGLYIIKGSLSITGNAAISGTGVTLDLLGSTTFTGNISLNLSAPTSGAYNGILIYQPASNTSNLSITGNSGSALKGVIYAPASNVTFTGNSSATFYTDYVSKTLTVTGNSSFNDYESLAGVTSPFTAAALVE